MNMTPPPKSNAMLICDYVLSEQGTNKKSLIGIFENIGASSFPCIHPSLCVYIKLTEATGTYKFRLELVNLQTNAIVAETEIPHEILIDHPLKIHELVFNLQGLRFEQAGEYEFRIYANDKIFGQKTFSVTALTSRERPL